MADQLCGQDSGITIDGTAIPLTKFSPGGSVKYGNTTDTGNLNSTGLLATSQLPATVTTKFSVEGWYRVSTTPGAIVAKLYASAAGPWPVVLTLATGVPFGRGDFDISDFECGVPCDDTVTFSCNLMSNGTFTPG